jgi:hypothetical protein
VRGFRAIGGALAVSFLLLGCGSGGSSSSGGSSTSVGQAAGAGPPGSVPTKPVKGAQVVPPPSPKESIADAVERIGGVIKTGDCRAINELTALSRPYDVCDGLRSLSSLPVAAAASYSDGAAVAEYGSGHQFHSALLIVDADGRYHLPLVDPYNTARSVGTPFPTEFDHVAQQAVNAMRDQDCGRFQRVALARYGAGAASVCTYLRESPLSQLLQADPQAQLRRLGGNHDYAFYTVSGRTANFTLLLARESGKDVASATPPLPAGAPELGFVDAYQTNPALPAVQPAPAPSP